MFFGFITETVAQVGVGTSSPNASAALEVSSTSKGFLPPRMTAAQRDAISNPSQGLMLYCIDCGIHGELQIFNGIEYTNIIGAKRQLSFRTQLGTSIYGENSNDRSGISVELSSNGSILAIGARYNDGNGSNSGHVRVYKYSNSSWTQLGSDIDGETSNDNSGYAISLNSDGTKLAVGAYGNDGNGNRSGHVRVYEYSNSSWTQLGSDIDGETADDLSGVSVELSDNGQIVAIGAFYNDGNGTNSGQVRVYKDVSGLWTQIGTDIDGSSIGEEAGTSISLSGDGFTLAIGAPRNSENASSAGEVRIYSFDGYNWIKKGQDLNGDAAGDYFGISVSLSNSGSILAVGAYGNDDSGTDAGQVKIFEFNANAWVQRGPKILGEMSNDYSGRSVSLSGDGNLLAIGAYGNDGTANDAGQTRIFQYGNSSWSKVDLDIYGDNSGDNSGISVTLSSDGSTLAVGAEYCDGLNNLNDIGQVKVFIKR